MEKIERINFYEEYPDNPENLEKARLIDFPSMIYIAAHSVSEFKKFREKLLAINPKLEAAYWPIINRSYWVSAFSYSLDLEGMINDVLSAGEPLTVLVDLELPILAGRRHLFFKNLFSFSNNKKMIRNFLRKASRHGITPVTAQYPAPFGLAESVYRFLGNSYDPVLGHRSSPMYYSSMIADFLKPMMHKHLTKQRSQNRNLELSLGVIATGVFGNEQILTPQMLSQDLQYATNAGFKTVTLFRLGGLNSEYVEVIKSFL
ncbi:MAG: hypothetical protein JWM20_192 [Patescibacteria group bacterium]|nr:hypothetical protein [Patescibacteria group bacterium]